MKDEVFLPTWPLRPHWYRETIYSNPSRLTFLAHQLRLLVQRLLHSWPSTKPIHPPLICIVLSVREDVLAHQERNGYAPTNKYDIRKRGLAFWVLSISNQPLQIVLLEIGVDHADDTHGFFLVAFDCGGDLLFVEPQEPRV